MGRTNTSNTNPPQEFKDGNKFQISKTSSFPKGQGGMLAVLGSKVEIIEDLLNENKKFILSVMSPAFCTDPTCGPQLETLNEISDKYSDLPIVHLDTYSNPSQNFLYSSLRLSH